DENNEEYVETENDENNEEYVETENDENNEEYVETENDKNNKEYVETEIDENRVETTTAPRRSQRFPFIPKFVVAPGSRRRSPFVAKRARFLDDAGLNDDVFDVSSSETPPRCDAFAAREIASENAEFAEIDLDKNATVAEIDLDENATVAEIDLDESFGAPRAPLAVEDEPVEPASLVPVASLADDASTNAIAQTPVSTACDAELSIAAEPSIAETSSSAAEQAEPFASDAQFNDFNDFNDFAPRTTSAERRLAELLGREPTPAEREEYYWETLDDEEPNDATEPKRRTQILRTAARVASEPAVAVGRATLAFCGAGSRRVLRETGLRRVLRGDDAIAATPTRRRRQPGQISDMMISTVSGVLIAVFIVFPMILAGFKDLFKTIAGSAVRKIGGVSVSETAPETDGFFFIADPLTRPTFESFEPTPLRETLLRETISDVKSRSVDEDDALVDAPLEDPLDPASTPPTLAPVPADLNAPYEKPF
ncbi:MAG: hypothetical protein IKU86_00630, partial [Thermoguttaceae bacterium]|nr:hypothetical protein [Thermoguttaceae bacterium]